jgi:hypothetical protein
MVSMRAADAIKANPEKSNRMIAEETGLGLATVRRARIATDPDGSVDSRIGLDGKVRRLPQKEEPKPEPPRANPRNGSGARCAHNFSSKPSNRNKQKYFALARPICAKRVGIFTLKGA